MIIKCYNCNELIGDNLDQCPLCHAKQFNEHKKTPKPDVYKLRQERVSNAMKAYKKRCRIQYVFILAELVFLLAGFTIGGITNLIYNPLFLLGLFVTPFALQLFGVKKFHINCCPYCREYFGHGGYHEHCPYCGGKLC